MNHLSRNRFFTTLVCLTLSSIAFGQASPADKTAPQISYILAGRLFDATSDTVRENMVIAVEDERIKSVASAADVKIPPGAKVIDLSQATVLPGLIDCHTHLGSRADRYNEIYNFKDTPFDHAFAAVLNARKTLEAGFTSVRDVGSDPFLAVDLRNSINEGYLVGPRVVASGPGISITGGHGDLNNFSPQTRVMMFPEERDFQIADSVDQIRHVIRAQEKYGVDVIKILATGGVLSRGDSPGAAQFTFEELKAAADTAHMGGRKIAAHAHGTEGIKNAIRAGIDSIEHGSLIDDEGIRLAKEHGTYLVMDIYNDDYILNEAPEVGIADRKSRQREDGGPPAAGEFPQGVSGRREDGIRHGRGCLSSRRQCEAVLLHGEVWHDAGTGHPRGHFKRRRSDRAGQGCGHS